MTIIQIMIIINIMIIIEIMMIIKIVIVIEINSTWVLRLEVAKKAAVVLGLLWKIMSMMMITMMTIEMLSCDDYRD